MGGTWRHREDWGDYTFRVDMYMGIWGRGDGKGHGLGLGEDNTRIHTFRVDRGAHGTY